MPVWRVAVVGSGPSGAYCAQALAEDALATVQVDVYDRLPTPYGLVRYGVAPDHQKIKSITASFAEIFANPLIRFLGNVEVGTDITVAELRSHYDAVVLAYGAALDRRLDVPGEELPGVIPARQFVSWYSGHPDTAVDAISITAEHAVVVGVGNVALDVARMLTRTADELRRTDVPGHVVDVLSAGTVRDITVIGRRGPVHAKFTNKEFLELCEVGGVDVVIDPAELELEAEQLALAAQNPTVARLVESMRRIATREPHGRERTIRFRFDRRPVAFVGDPSVSAVQLASSSDPRVREELPAEIVFPAVGYRGVPLPGVACDDRTGTVAHAQSRVLDGGQVVPGLYAVGWLKRGPTGVIGTNRRCAMETAEAILSDAAGAMSHASAPEATDALLRSRGIDVVDWCGWRGIDDAEQGLGRTIGRDRVKLHSRPELLRAAGVR